MGLQLLHSTVENCKLPELKSASKTTAFYWGCEQDNHVGYCLKKFSDFLWKKIYNQPRITKPPCKQINQLNQGPADQTDILLFVLCVFGILLMQDSAFNQDNFMLQMKCSHFQS